MVVYKHIRNDTNEVFYIGIGNEKRPYNKIDRNKYWHNIVNKVGYEIEILQENLSWEDACKVEINLIKKYGRKDIGNGLLVNMTDGGEGFTGTHTINTKEKISKSKIENYKNLELRKKLSKIAKDRLEDSTKNPFYGKHHTTESKEKMRISALGKHIAENNGMYGVTMSNETKLKLSDSLKNQKQIVCPHCNKQGNAGNMKYWHFDKCKNYTQNRI